MKADSFVDAFSPKTAAACACDGGWTGAACEKMRCPGAPLECSGAGWCLSFSGQCVCPPGRSGADSDVTLCGCTACECKFCGQHDSNGRYETPPFLTT